MHEWVFMHGNSHHFGGTVTLERTKGKSYRSGYWTDRSDKKLPARKMQKKGTILEMSHQHLAESNNTEASTDVLLPPVASQVGDFITRGGKYDPQVC